MDAQYKKVKIDKHKVARIQQDTAYARAALQIMKGIFEEFPVRYPQYYINPGQCTYAAAYTYMLADHEYVGTVGIGVFETTEPESTERAVLNEWRKFQNEWRVFIAEVKNAPEPTEDESKAVFEALRYARNRWWGKKAHEDGMYYNSLAASLLNEE